MMVVGRVVIAIAIVVGVVVEIVFVG